MKIKRNQNHRRLTSRICRVSSLLALTLMFSLADAFVSNNINIEININSKSNSNNIIIARPRSRSRRRIGSALRMKLGSSNDIKYIRIQPRNVRGNRRAFELQTAVTTLSKVLPNGDVSAIDLHAQLHFGDDVYFQLYNEENFQSKYDQVF